MNVMQQPQIGDIVEILPGTKVAGCFMGGRRGKVLELINASGITAVSMEYQPGIEIVICADLVEVVKVAA